MPALGDTASLVTTPAAATTKTAAWLPAREARTERALLALTPAAAAVTALAQEAAPAPSEPAANITALLTTLMGSCSGPQAAAAGLTAELVGLFFVAFSRHFTPVQKQEAAACIEGMVGAGQLGAVKAYLEGMPRSFGIGP